MGAGEKTYILIIEYFGFSGRVFLNFGKLILGGGKLEN